MRDCIVINHTKESILFKKAYIANSFFLRLIGLLGKKELEENSCMIIKPCKSIHTIGMKFPIDVAFIDNRDRVCYIINGMKPFRISPIIKSASYIIEGPKGHFLDNNLDIGDEIEVRAV